MSAILVVEDHDDVRAVVRAALEDDAYEVFEAANGATGLSCALQLQPDVVLLDVMMPGALDGFSVCAALKQHAATAHTRVVMLTARCMTVDLHRGRVSGCDAYIMKPFSPEQLRQTVHSLLKHRVLGGRHEST